MIFKNRVLANRTLFLKILLANWRHKKKITATRCLIIILKILVIYFSGSKSNKILQLGTTQNNEANVLESFFQIFCMQSSYLSHFLAIPKIIN
jgi:hypothetical protein